MLPFLYDRHKKRPAISFEFFPAKTEKSDAALQQAMDVLASGYMTVTYGAGGGTRDGTFKTLTRARDAYGIPLASHLTFINSTKEQMYALADELWNENIKHIIALRGDMPDDLQWPLDMDGNYFQYTSYFVEALLARHPFEISVGCYPEKHPDASNMNADIEALKLKCGAGAHRAITQFFFDNDVFYEFRDTCAKAGIKTPIIPGVLPIHDFKSMCGFAKRCHTDVPDWLHDKFSGLENNPQEAEKIASDLLSEQVADLQKNGVEHFHFYTLNKSNITAQACEYLGYKAKK
jgi:methylenetetrahydrofolate reductase (NADPH)